MTNRTSLVLRAVRSTVDGVTDRDLLTRFAAGEETAFAALVERHAGMVLGVCRRALPTVQDAEDACQATFLVLSRKAAGGRWHASVANWLYTTARRTAAKANLAATRRARREATVGKATAESPLDLMTGREAFAALDEELDRLPSTYREPLVLCYLEGLTRDEAAKRLGVAPATVKSQLERGRKKLGDALTRRGIGLGAGLLALAATSRAGASPPRMSDSIVAAAQGIPRPAVAALAEGIAVNGIVKKFVILAALLAVTAAIGFSPRGLTTAGQPDKAMPAKHAAQGDGPAAAKASEARTVSGTVVDPAGKSVPGADVVHFPLGGKPTVVAKTDEAGKFKVTVLIQDPGAWLFPRVAGYGPKDFLMPATNTPAEMTFRLVKDVPIRGRVVDTQGKPVAGAAVVVRSLSGFEEESLDRFLAAWLKRDIHGHGSAHPRGGVHWTASGGGMAIDRKLADGTWMYGATTDRDGKFEITNCGAEREVHLQVRAPGIAGAEIAVITREGFDPTPYNRLTLEALKDEYAAFLGRHYLMYPPSTNIVVEAEQLIRGVVTDEAGKPVPGVRVRVRADQMRTRDEKAAVTDEAGKYEVRGLRKLDGYRVSFSRNVDRALLGRDIAARPTSGYEPIVVDATLMKGIVLTGTIRDGGTGQPTEGYACVGVLFDNEYAKKPGYDSPDCYDYAYAKADGVYRTVVPPGPIIAMIGTHGMGTKRDPQFAERRTDPDYPQYFAKDISGFRSPGNSTTMIQGQFTTVLILKPDQPVVTHDVVLKRASILKVRIEDAAGKPVKEAMVAGTRSQDWYRPDRAEGGACEVYELDGKKPRAIVAHDPTTGQVGTMTLKGDETDPVLRLGPAAKVKGRLVDADGKPFAGARVSIGYLDRSPEEIDRIGREDLESEGKPTETDADGRFEKSFVVPGWKFQVYGTLKGKYLSPRERKREKATAVKPGETIDLGNIVLKAD